MTQFLIRCFIKHPEDTASPLSAPPTATWPVWWAWPATCFLCLGKLAAGTLFGSIAIMADALNNLRTHPPTWSAWWGSAWRPKPRTKTPYGHARYELPGRTGGQCHHSGHRVFSAERIGCAALPAGCHGIQLGIGGGAGCFHRRKALAQRLLPQGGAASSALTLLLAAAADSRNDVLSTGAVLLSTFVYRFTGWTRLDALMGLAVSAFILWSGWHLVLETLSPCWANARRRSWWSTLSRP